MVFLGWSRLHEVSEVIKHAVIQKRHDAFCNLEKVLNKHKNHFSNLLKNPPRNTSHRSDVKAATKTGLQVSSLSNPLILPQDFIDEALILSDILDLNELTAVELLLAGEQNQPDFPSLTRGLVAILLYYDSKQTLVDSLRVLIQARQGFAWTNNLPNSVCELVTKFTDDLLYNSRLLEEILKQSAELSVEKELEKLSKGQAVKDGRHREDVIALIEGIKHIMMDCLFYWSCQTPFDKERLSLLIKQLKKTSDTSEGHHPLDQETLALYFTLVSSFSVGSHSTDHQSLESNLDDSLPVFRDRLLIPSIHSEVIKNDWSNPALGAAVQFAWAVFLRECSPFDVLREFEELKEDEDIIDNAVCNEVFQFLRQSVVASPHFFTEDLYVKQLHHILTSYIVLMPNKITELRNHGDEVAREEVVRVANTSIPQINQLRQDFGEMMKLVGDLYYKDTNGLSSEYWAPVEEDFNSSVTTGMKTIKASHRQLSLLKFVHQCSELLPPGLFASFMSLLVGLSNSKETARHCFNFLKSNSPSLGGGGPSASFSLDHFFHSLKQYYYALKQDARMKQTPSGCAISPQEVNALLAVLKLIKAITKYDENARVVMYENQSWLPVASMFGLIGCAIPLPLKSEIFLTLAEFARSPEIASAMWQTLENSQVLNTVPNIAAGSDGFYGLGPSSTTEGSIQIELEEIESAAEEYHQTRAFLFLLNSMCDVVVPSSLGMGHRVPGFHPYLEFVMDSILLKFDSRGYKDPQEKWLMAAGAMEVVLKLLYNHDITPQDLEQQMYEVSPGRMVPLPSQPGHVILHNLLNDSVLLRKILFIADECCLLLTDVDSTTDTVSRAALLALKILECALKKQEAFLSVLRGTSGHSVMATPLDHLLLSVNPRTHVADYYTTISRYVTFKYCSTELALTAVKILCSASNSVSVSKEILNSLVVSQDVCVSVIHGFVECLESKDVSQPDDESSMEEGNESCSEDDSKQLKEEILNLLILCAKSSTPNIGRLLLGLIQPPFDKKKLKESALQDPGILGSLKTCLHSVLQLVSIGDNPREPTGCQITHPRLAEKCYHLLYLMCVNKNLTGYVMRYLRNNYNYFHVQLSNIPFPWFHELPDPVISLHQQSWLLSSIALDLRMTSLKTQHSHTQQLVALLLKSTTLTDQFNDITPSQVPVWSTDGHINYDPSHSLETSTANEGRRKILTILDYISFESLPIPALQLQYFDIERVETVIKSCEVRDDNDCLYVDVQALRGLLMAELNSVQGAAIVSQKHFILQEILDVLKSVVERNRVNELMHCRQQLMEAWSKVVEVMVGVINEDQDKRDVKISVLFEIVQDLLLKVDKVDVNSLTASAHGVIFILMSHLRQSVLLLNQSDGSEDKSTTLGPLMSGPLQSIFSSLLHNLMKCPIGMQRLRTHLYSSLLSYLQMTKEKQEDTTGVWRLESDNGLTSANLAVLSDCGEGLMDVVCRDACSGHDVAKMLSLSLLDSILVIDRRCYWLQYMTTCGYLQKICSSLLWEDEVLLTMLHPHPEALKPLYIYESKMAFLCRVASSTVGARDLVSLNCLTPLNECRYIDNRPGNHYHADPLQPRLMPSVNVRYLQLLFPVLRLLLAILTTPGSHTMEASNQVLVFIRSHMDVFITILKDTSSTPTLGYLQELSLVTAIISHCKAGHDVKIDPQSNNPSLSQDLLLIQGLLLSLLPNYLTPEHWKRIAQDVAKNEGSDGRGQGVSSPVWEEAYGLSQRVCSNLLMFCQNAISALGSEFSVNFYRILFTPVLSQALTPTVPQGFASSSSGVSPPTLGLLIVSLRSLCDGHFSAVEFVTQLQKKLDGVKNMISEEMKTLVPEANEKTTLTTAQLQQLSRTYLQKALEAKKQQVALYIYNIEHMLCILWRHLQFFLIHCQPTDRDGSMMDGDMFHTKPVMRKLHDPSSVSAQPPSQGGLKERFDLSLMTSGISLNDLEQFKKNIGTCLPDSLFKKLLDINNGLSQSSDDITGNFILTHVRRIKKLLKLKAAAKPLLQL